jgi:ribosomal protein S30
MLSFMIRSTRVGLQLYSYSAENFLIFTYTHESLQGRGSHFTPRITLKTKKKNPGPRKRKRKNYPEDTKKEESCTQKRRAILQQKEKSND